MEKPALLLLLLPLLVLRLLCLSGVDGCPVRARRVGVGSRAGTPGGCVGVSSPLHSTPAAPVTQVRDSVQAATAKTTLELRGSAKGLKRKLATDMIERDDSHWNYPFKASVKVMGGGMVSH